VIFLIAFVATATLEAKVDGGATVSAAIGSAALLLGIFSVPLMLGAAKTNDLGTEDYLFGSCFVLMFVLVGGGFAWTGFSGIVRGLRPDRRSAGRDGRGEQH
jgi:hypothetical protein